MKKFFLILTTVLAQSAFAQIEVNKGKFTWETSFPVVTCGRESASILYDRNDFRPVGTAVGMLAEDIKRTTDADMPIINSIPQKAKSLIVAGTIGKSRFIDMLEESGKLNTGTIAGQWERFIIKTVENPFDGVDKALVIAGSDKRGTALRHYHSVQGHRCFTMAFLERRAGEETIAAVSAENELHIEEPVGEVSRNIHKR